MKELLERLIQQVQDNRLVEKLEKASSLEERVKLCEEARKTEDFEKFRALANKFIIEKIDGEDEQGTLLSGTDFVLTEDNAVEVAIILIITGTDDLDVFDYSDELIVTLQEVEGAQEEIAQTLANFFEVCFVNKQTLKEILEKIF